MPRPFSRTHRTYAEWAGQARPSPYKATIERLHTIYPESTLSQLRRHPAHREHALGVLHARPVHARSWSTLTPTERELRSKSLKVISQMRRHGYSLTRASRDAGISPYTVRRHTNAVRYKGYRYRPKAYDRIDRRMAINEGGRERWITVKDSRHASMIGRYHSAVRQFLETGDASHLKPFKGKRVRDIDGNWHTLETDPDKLYEIEEQREEEEFYSIYEG
jgi:hypothetical protein